MFKYLAILAILPALIMGDDYVTFTACRAGGHQPDWVQIEGCNTLSCTVSRTAPISVRAQVYTIQDSQELDVNMVAIVLGQEVVLGLPEEVSNGCNVVNCPLIAGNTVMIEASALIEIQEYAVGLTVPVELSATNETGERVFCVNTSVTIAA